jgi:hypothetical protein
MIRTEVVTPDWVYEFVSRVGGVGKLPTSLAYCAVLEPVKHVRFEYLAHTSWTEHRGRRVPISVGEAERVLTVEYAEDKQFSDRVIMMAAMEEDTLVAVTSDGLLDKEQITMKHTFSRIGDIRFYMVGYEDIHWVFIVFEDYATRQWYVLRAWLDNFETYGGVFNK